VGDPDIAHHQRYRHRAALVMRLLYLDEDAVPKSGFAIAAAGVRYATDARKPIEIPTAAARSLVKEQHQTQRNRCAPGGAALRYRLPAWQEAGL
jgi:hypothetical protein